MQLQCQADASVDIRGGLGPLLLPFDQVLTSGGDTRLHLDPLSMLNGYGCRPFPRPEAFTFASSTATSISDRAYAAAERLHRALIDAGDEWPDRCESELGRLRGQLADLLGLGHTDHQIIFSPSGTDSELHALFVALRSYGTPLVSVVAASDETGGGTTLAAIGRHFSALTSQGVAVIKSEPIAGMAENVTSVAVPLRANGALRAMADIDAEVTRAVAESVANGRRVLLHVMDHSKLGWRCPSIDCVREIGARWPQSVAVVVDACQMRLSRSWLLRYLEHGYMVQVTGSKFFTGPPFSGALLVPASLSARMRDASGVPIGLSNYTAAADWPPSWPGVRASLPVMPNVGQFLRWTAAAEEMRDYFSVPTDYRRQAYARFASTVPALFKAHDNLELLPDGPRPRWDGVDNEELGVRTIFPFFVCRDARRMSIPEATTVYRALNHDLTSLLPDAIAAEDRALGAQLCHIGQPVAVSNLTGDVAGTLRISAGARIVSETWSPDGEAISTARLQREFEQVHTILDKIQLILRHFDRMHGRF
jgi:hypothetical protein